MQEYNRFLGEAQKMYFPQSVKEGKVAWQCPSNIALIKYWGKRDVQLPMNPSLSFTLKEAATLTKVQYAYDPHQTKLQLSYKFEGIENLDFSNRIADYLSGLEALMPFIPRLKLIIYSENTFPHSSGIASSASAFGALALCLIEIEEQLAEIQTESETFFRKASFIARLGSGSASRSVFGGLVLWGHSPEFEYSSDEYAIPVNKQINNKLPKFYDAILLLDKSVKKVSSSAGHAMMHKNPYAEVRFRQATDNLVQLTNTIEANDLIRFIDIVEYEALSLHAMMLTSYPGYLLLKPSSLEVIQKIRSFRKESQLPIGFTIDAGANIHLLFPAEAKPAALDFIDRELKSLCVNNSYLLDEVGDGPQKLVL